MKFFFSPFYFKTFCNSVSFNALSNTTVRESVMSSPHPSFGWYFWSYANCKPSSLLLYQFNKKAILIESSSSMWQLKPLTNYSEKYIYGNHRNCILCDVWREVVTQNYLLLCWRTQWRIFSKLKVKRAETLAMWEQIPQLLPKLVPLYSNL